MAPESKHERRCDNGCIHFKEGKYVNQCKDEKFPDNMDSAEDEYILKWISSHGCASYDNGTPAPCLPIKFKIFYGEHIVARYFVKGICVPVSFETVINMVIAESKGMPLPTTFERLNGFNGFGLVRALNGIMPMFDPPSAETSIMSGRPIQHNGSGCPED